MTDDGTHRRRGVSNDHRGTASRRDFLKATAGAGALATGLGGVGAAGATDHGIDTPWLHRDGNLIKDPTDSQVVLRGVNIADPKRLNATAPARGKNAEQVVDLATDESAGWNARMIRIPVQPWDVGELPPVPLVEDELDGGYHAPPAFTREELVEYCETHLDPIVEYCRQRNVYCIVDFHRHWGNGDLEWTNDALDEEVRLFWRTVAPRYADQPHVLFEVYNEPTMPGMYSDIEADHVEETWLEWKATCQPWVDIIRQSAPRNLILVGSPGWSSTPEGAGIEEFDGENLGYTYHVYPGHRVEDYDGTADEATRGIWQDVPLFTTEFGFEDAGPGKRYISGTQSGYGEPIKEWMDGKPIHWTAWCFDVTWLPSMFERGDWATSSPQDAIGNPYDGGVEEVCPDRPCEWVPLTGDGGQADFVKEWLAERADDDVPTVDHDPEPPERPANLTAADAGLTAIDLSWDPVADPGPSSLARYVVTLDGERATTVPAGTTETTLSDLIAGTDYEVGVRAVDVAGNEGPVATTTVTTPASADEVPPAAPTEVAMDGSTYRSVDVSWPAAANEGPAGLHHYEVFVDGESDQQVPGGETTATIDDLRPDTTYEVAVRAVDAAGNASERSDPTTVRTQVDRPGEDALVLHDFDADGPWPGNNVAGNWAGAGGLSGTERSESRLRLEYAEGGWFGTDANVDASAHSYLKIRLTGDAGGEGEQIDLSVGEVEDALATLADGTVHDRPSLLAVDMEAVGIDPASPGQLRLLFDRSASGAVEIDAIWFDDEVPGSPPDETAPTAPDEISVVHATERTATVEWSPASDEGGSELAGYEVAVDGTHADAVAEDTTRTTVLDLSPGTSYEVSVRAVDGANNVSDPIATTVTTAGDGDGETPPDGPSPVGGGDEPRDPDEDGLYEDVNGDGATNLADAGDLFQHRNDDAVREAVEAYDFSGNDEIDLADVVGLFEENAD